MSDKLIVIPARYDSSRFPGKPLAAVAGKTLLERVWSIAVHALGSAEGVLVATDDERIVGEVARFGGQSVMTDPALASGTDRIYAAAQAVGSTASYIVNLQGDAVLTPPHVIRAIFERLAQSDCGLVTAATPMTWEALAAFETAKNSGEVGGTTVTVSKNGKALYFSKQVIPFLRKGLSTLQSESSEKYSPVLRHIGIYGFKRETLASYVALSASTLEVVEGLEQLRALENGIDIDVVSLNYYGRSHLSIDSPEDIPRVEQAIEQEGELF